jgi:hypothetical protein
MTSIIMSSIEHSTSSVDYSTFWWSGLVHLRTRQQELVLVLGLHQSTLTAAAAKLALDCCACVSVQVGHSLQFPKPLILLFIITEFTTFVRTTPVLYY